jgi:hypothetical protein
VQLDRTEIVIRQRTGLELFDLSLLLLKRHFLRIAATSAMLGLPLLGLNVLAIAWMLGEDAYLASEHLSAPREAMWWRYTGHLLSLYVLQFQLVSLPTTVYLGNIIFFEKMNMFRLVRRLAPIAIRGLVVLGLLRLGLISLMLVWFINRSLAFDSNVEFWLLFIIPGVALILRAAWPFAPEILGLEFCRLRKSTSVELSYWQRSKGLHSPMVSENITRFIAATFFAVLLCMMLLATTIFVQGVLSGDWLWNRWFDYLVFPLCMWLVGLFMAVFRFLSYLDSRIRLEGWEVELQLRAETARLTHVSKPTTGLTTLTTGANAT